MVTEQGKIHGDDTAGSPSQQAPVVVVICGAGPSGLLLAHHLLSFGGGNFKVVIYDKGEDPRETLKHELNHRRFTIGIARRGENSISFVPGLLAKVKRCVVTMDTVAMVVPMMRRPIVGRLNKPPEKNFLADRFSLCASLMDALDEFHADKRQQGLLTTRFSCACVGVDLQRQLATFQPQSRSGGGAAQASAEDVIAERYDLLVGADGLRSAVRAAFQQQVRNFEVEQKKLPGTWTVTHLPCPEGFPKSTVHMLNFIPKSGGMLGMAMPSPDGSLCFILGWVTGDDPSQWLACSTPNEARDFIHSRLPHFNITEEAAWKLRSAPLQSSMQVKCWRYHDEVGHAVLIGDAAHCTAPSIGQGCNASLVDACVLGRLLLGEVVTEQNRSPDGPLPEDQKQLWATKPNPAEIREKLPKLLRYFSALQVKEGHALVDLSNANGPVGRWTKLLHGFMFLVRFFLHKMLPFLVLLPVIGYASESNVGLSDIHQAFRWETDFLLWCNKKAMRQHDAQQQKLVVEKQL